MGSISRLVSRSIDVDVDIRYVKIDRDLVST